MFDNESMILFTVIAVIATITLFFFGERLVLKKEISLCHITVSLYVIPKGADLEAFLKGKYAAQKIKEQGFSSLIPAPKNVALPLLIENIKSNSPEMGELDLIIGESELYHSYGGVKKLAFSSINAISLKEEQTKLIYKQIMDMTSKGERIMLVLG